MLLVAGWVDLLLSIRRSTFWSFERRHRVENVRSSPVDRRELGRANTELRETPANCKLGWKLDQIFFSSKCKTYFTNDIFFCPPSCLSDWVRMWRMFHWTSHKSSIDWVCLDWATREIGQYYFYSYSLDEGKIMWKSA